MYTILKQKVCNKIVINIMDSARKICYKEYLEKNQSHSTLLSKKVIYARGLYDIDNISCVYTLLFLSSK